MFCIYYAQMQLGRIWMEQDRTGPAICLALWEAALFSAGCKSWNHFGSEWINDGRRRRNMSRRAKYFIPAVQRFDLKFELNLQNSDKYELNCSRWSKIGKPAVPPGGRRRQRCAGFTDSSTVLFKVCTCWIFSVQLWLQLLVICLPRLMGIWWQLLENNNVTLNNITSGLFSLTCAEFPNWVLNSISTRRRSMNVLMKCSA